MLTLQAQQEQQQQKPEPQIRPARAARQRLLL
jgi:hypothetical protein